MVFQSTPSAWRETDPEKVEGVRKWHFNPLPPHGGRQCAMDMIFRCRIISIHSLRMEGDPILDTQVLVHRDFNPLPPHGGRLASVKLFCGQVKFQSTPSAWRETDACQFGKWAHSISIHSLRMEGDRLDCLSGVGGAAFQSTPSAWRETMGS